MRWLRKAPQPRQTGSSGSRGWLAGMFVTSGPLAGRFVTDMLGFGTGDMTPENELELQQAGNEFRHYAHDAFGDGWLGQFSGELLTLGK